MATTQSHILMPVEDLLNRLQPVDPPQVSADVFQTSALRVKVPIYHLWEGATEREQRAVMIALTLCGRSDDEKPVYWQTWVLTWSCIVFPELVPVMKQACHAGEYEFRVFSHSFVEEAVQAVLAQGDEDTAGDRFLTFDRGFPNASLIPLTAELAAASGVEGLYAYYAMIVFIMGKSLNPTTVTAISGKRPAALMKKRKISSSEYILTGDGRMTTDNYGRIQGGWVRSTAPRMIIVRHLADLYAAGSRPETLDPLVVNLDMLKNAGQTYIFFIFELLTACPWCLELPVLRANYRHYSKMVSKIASQPINLQPFYKLMMQDADKDIRRRNIESLIAVSVYYIAQTRKSMSQYRIHPDSKPVIEAFRALAAAKGIQFVEIKDQAIVDVSTV